MKVSGSGCAREPTAGSPRLCLSEERGYRARRQAEGIDLLQQSAPGRKVRSRVHSR
eukprot:COSAG06_NODE_2478_length_6797_cov_23.033000_3_plen_56_part_00